MYRIPTAAAFRFLAGVFIAAALLHTFLVMGLNVPVVVNGSSMSSTLEDQERLAIDRTAFAFRQPYRWEVVVFRAPENANELCVKRIVGLPGEIVSLADGDIVINGEKVPNPRDEKYVIRLHDRPQEIVDTTTGPPVTYDGWQLGPTEYFVLGDNGAVSDDSRNWPHGPGLDAKFLVGKPLGVR